MLSIEALTLTFHLSSSIHYWPTGGNVTFAPSFLAFEGNSYFDYDVLDEPSQPSSLWIQSSDVKLVAKRQAPESNKEVVFSNKKLLQNESAKSAAETDSGDLSNLKTAVMAQSDARPVPATSKNLNMTGLISFSCIVLQSSCFLLNFSVSWYLYEQDRPSDRHFHQ